MGEKSRVTILDDCRGQQSNSRVSSKKNVFLGNFRFVFFYFLANAVMMKAFRIETF